MNSKMIIALFFSFLGLTVNLQAQDDAKQQQEKKELQRRVLEVKRERLLRERSVQVQTTKYNQRESEIYAKLNVEVIPDNFPVYKSEYTNEQYTILMNKWYSANPALVKKETNTNQPK